ncbi:MAG: L-2-amino-thiazoline-4-carboxylic acid hydrolase [Lachnospiraceae bacterium]|nr:L-2-amino-thiazoline-4-carboxylic acid hydrolase [Lachnospiraceae bacterium]
MDTQKAIKEYGKYYRIALEEGRFDNIEEKMKTFEKRLEEMYSSENFKKHNIYPTMNVTYIYAVIAMCLEIKELGYSDKEIIEILNKGFDKRRDRYRRIIAFLNNLPNSFSIARRWNINDHKKRVEDGSITYDYFNVSKDKVEYSISKCMYVEMFETYGIRGLCKIFCMTDEFAYAGLTRHVNFIRHSDLSDGPACFDEVIRR